MDATLESVRDAVEPALDTDRPLPDPVDEYQARLTRTHEQADTLIEDLNTDYLRQEELAELAALRAELEELHERVTAKQAYETHIEPIETHAEELQEMLAPYRASDEYLIREVETIVRDALDTLDSQLTALPEEIVLDRLSEADRTHVRDLGTWVDETRAFLDEYNDEFIEQEIHAHDDLFMDIDAAGHDLTLSQRRAVVRNDTRNQVIAAAGTGKTLVLTYRIAYLVNKQDVDPSQIVALTYTRKATREMAARLEREFGITDVEVSTLHAFGRRIANEAADRQLSPADPSTIESIIQDIIPPQPPATARPRSTPTPSPRRCRRTQAGWFDDEVARLER